MSDSWRVILCTDIGAEVVEWFDAFLTARGHKLVGIVTSPKRFDGYVDVVRAAPSGVDVLVTSRPRRVTSFVRDIEPDLLLCCVTMLKIPGPALAITRLGALNEHPGLLPQYRGVMPPFWAIRNNETETGATVHFMEETFDTGRILSQIRFPIGPEDDMTTIFPKLFWGIKEELWETAFEKLARGDRGEPQDESQARYYSMMEESWSHVAWCDPVQTIHNQVRCWASDLLREPGVYAKIEDEPIRIIKARPQPASVVTAEPGTVLERDEETLLVQCGDGALLVTSWEPAGESE